MAVVHPGTGLAGGADDLLGAVDGPVRGELDQVARVGEGRRAAGQGERRDAQVLPGSRTWRVPDQESDPQRPVGDVGFEDPEDAVEFRSRWRRVATGGPRGRRTATRPSSAALTPASTAILAITQEAAKP